MTIPAVDATCPEHLAEAAVATCVRCGRYVCARCGAPRQRSCSACLARVNEQFEKAVKQVAGTVGRLRLLVGSVAAVVGALVALGFVLTVAGGLVGGIIAVFLAATLIATARAVTEVVVQRWVPSLARTASADFQLDPTQVDDLLAIYR